MVVRILKRKLKVPSFIVNYKETLYEGMRGYHYFKKRWVIQLDEFNIEYTEKEVRKLAVQDFIKAKEKAVLLITLFLVVLLFVIMVLVKPINFLFGQMKIVFSYLRVYFKDVSSDAWLGFWGSVLGSIVTMLGIIITIRFERKKDEIARKKQAQPILMLQHRKRDDEQNQNNYKSSYYIDFCSLKGKELEYNIIESQLPDLILRNVGFNAAINIELLFFIDGMKSCGCSGLDYLPSNEYEAIKIVVEMYRQEIEKVFENIQYKKRGDSGIVHAYFMNAYTNLKTEIHDKIKFVAGKKGNLAIKYQDVYGNEYYHYYGLSFWLVGLNDDTFISYMTYPTYSRKIKPAKRK